MGRTDQGVLKTPEGMKVTDWCKDHGISKANYYYRLRQIRCACLEAIPEEAHSNPVVPVKQELLMSEQTNRNIMGSGLEIRLGDCILYVAETTLASRLSKVIGVIRDAQCRYFVSVKSILSAAIPIFGLEWIAWLR